MSKRFKNKVRITTANYRIVQTNWRSGLLERANGHDLLGVRRWHAVPHEEQTSALLREIISEIGAALAKRAKRRAKR